ncbi:MAG: hypothetical protein RJB65_430 [Actinomycetota bacterium]
MPFQPQRGRFYRMPVFFGPMPGPREWPEGRDFDFRTTPRMRMLGVRMLTNADQLTAMLPDRFELRGAPVVTVELNYMTEIGWLAGRGYNLCDVKFEVTYHAKSGPVNGTLVLVRWENLCDPILSGREELGHNKLYCEIPEPRFVDERRSVRLSWLDTPFMDLSVTGLTPIPGVTRPKVDPEHHGMLSYKYIPRTGDWGEADVEYVTLSPNDVMRQNMTITNFEVGTGEFAFRHTTWDELPTLYRIVNAFADLENHGFQGAHLLETIGGSSIAETIRLD